MLGLTHDVDVYLRRMQEELGRLDPRQVRGLADAIHCAWLERKFIFIFGNGGSGATASHFAEDLGKNALSADELLSDSVPRPRVMSLTDNTSWITAVANDLSYEQIFAQQLAHYASPGDLAVAVSGSGNSPNVLAAVDWANRHRLVTFGLTGYDGGRLHQIAEHALHIPLHDMGMVESVHLALVHWLVEDLHGRIHRSGRYANSG